MRGTNMSFVGCEVVKYFSTCTTSEGELRCSLLVSFEMTIETDLLSETLIKARTFVGFLSSMDTSVPI